MKEGYKRLFFGVEVQAPWPEKLPLGRMLDEKHRHMTLAFLGNVPFPPLQESLKDIPHPGIKVGISGHFDACLFLPPGHPNVVAWRAVLKDEQLALANFQQTLSRWLMGQGYFLQEREWLPHMTLCRKPFDPHAWKKTFVSLPMCTGSIHLYESMGNLVYEPIWSFPIKKPFDEIEHTADIAFLVRGETLLQIYHNAFTALAFKFAPLLNFFKPRPKIETIDEIVMALNESVGDADGLEGCPFKAVSFHGDVIQLEDSTLQWEMIVDV